CASGYYGSWMDYW
nr:immunoglobulin heavy chain junction region [Mus musculus]